MPTLRELASELAARKARLDVAEKNGWRDAIPGARETYSEMLHVMQAMIETRMSDLVAVAGHVDLGPLPVGVSLAYSQPYEPQPEPKAATEKPYVLAMVVPTAIWNTATGGRIEHKAPLGNGRQRVVVLVDGKTPRVAMEMIGGDEADIERLLRPLCNSLNDRDFDLARRMQDDAAIGLYERNLENGEYGNVSPIP